MKAHSKLFLIGLLLAITSNIGTYAQNVGSSAPDFTLDVLGGGSFTLAQESGKVVFIFFFGNACSHCKANGPNTQTDIYEVYKANPNFVAIGVDTWNGNASAVQGYKSTTNIEYPLLLNGSALENSYNTTYDRIIIVDKQGVIRYKSTTVANKTTTAEASLIINDLLENTSGIINKTSTKQFLLAPNMVQNQLIICNPFESTEQVKIKIIDLAGKVMLSTNSIDLNTEEYIDVSVLNPGLYTVVLTTNKDYRIAKFVKTM